MSAMDWTVTKELRASWATYMSGWRSRTVSAVYCKAVSPSGQRYLVGGLVGAIRG
jgi:hypothetical protein